MIIMILFNYFNVKNNNEITDTYQILSGLQIIKKKIKNQLKLLINGMKLLILIHIYSQIITMTIKISLILKIIAMIKVF